MHAVSEATLAHATRCAQERGRGFWARGAGRSDRPEAALPPQVEPPRLQPDRTASAESLLAPKPSHFPGEGQTHHLPVHGRGHVAGRHVGIQAEAAGQRRQGRSGRRNPDRVEVQVRSPRADRHVGVGALSATGQESRSALLHPRTAHRYAGPSASRRAVAHRRAERDFTRPSMGAWLLYGLGSENQDLPGYITINPSPEFRRRTQLRHRVSAGPLPGDADRRHRPHAQPAGANGPVAAAPADRSDPGDEPRPGRNVGRPGPARRRDPIVRAGLSHGGQGLDAARHFARAAVGARRLRCETRAGGKLRPAVPDGPPAERGGRAVRRDLPIGMGPPLQLCTRG